jgi:hypothetical protein
VNLNGTPVIDTFPGASENFINTAAAQLVFTLNSMSGKTLSNLKQGQLYILFAVDLPANSRRAVVPL